MFALGIAAYYLRRMPWRPRIPLLAPTVVGLACLLTHNPGIVIWCAVFMAAYEPAAFRAGVLPKVLEHPLALTIGQMSYSIYLVHEAVLTPALISLDHLGASVVGQWPFFIALLTLTLAGTLGLSWLLYRHVDVRFIAFGKRERRPVAI